MQQNDLIISNAFLNSNNKHKMYKNRFSIKIISENNKRQN